MGYDRQKYEYFFPRKVYQCPCLGAVITSCLHDGIYSLADICDEITQTDCTESQKVYCTKCGNDKQSVVFSCGQHMAMIILAVKRYDCTVSPNKGSVTIEFYDESKTYCRGCIKKYLQEMYYYYHFLHFDLPLGIQKRKRKLK